MTARTLLSSSPMECHGIPAWQSLGRRQKSQRSYRFSLQIQTYQTASLSSKTLPMPQRQKVERVPLLRSIPLFQFLRIMIRPHLYRQIGKYSGILNFRTFDYIHIALQNYNFFLQGLLFPPFLPGALNSHGTPTWHFPQPYLGECFTFISSSLALQRILFLPCSKEIA